MIFDGPFRLLRLIVLYAHSYRISCRVCRRLCLRIYTCMRVDLGDMNASRNLLRMANSASTSTHRLFSAPISFPLQHRALGCTVARLLVL